MVIDYARDVVTSDSNEVRRAWAIEKAIEAGFFHEIVEKATIIENYVKNGKKETEDEAG